MKICIFNADSLEAERFKQELPGHQVMTFHDNVEEVNFEDIKDADILSIFINCRVSRETINNMTNLKFITTRSTGFEHIDLNACKERNIKVSNVPFYGENTVAEHTFALILSLSRNIHKTYVRTMKNNFSLEHLQGFDLKDKVLGVIGAGKIGLHVIRMAQGFGMKVLTFDINRNDFMSEILNFEYASVEEILQKSDIISLHAPLNDHTYHLINKNNIRRIKRGALIVNTSRGGLIETEALIQALDEGIISGAGLDVFEGEEYILEEGCRLNKNYSEDVKKLVKNNCSLLHRENVVITPHNAFNSREAVERIFQTTVKNITAFAEGKPVNLV
jgi:D-lactate dehydrogenase